MEVSKIFNPAAVVNKTSAKASSDAATVNQEKKGSSRIISQESLLRAANGDNRLSQESQQAIANGALPPNVIIQTTQEITEAVEQTITLQQEPQTVFEDEAVVIALSNTAASLTAVTTETSTTSQLVQTTGSTAPVIENRDTASDAFGNTVDVEV